ncbi:hypothetical protein JHK85_005865 [Glycine max]|nr:hypothetical protein JHK85_005865 [Glycine max]
MAVSSDCFCLLPIEVVLTILSLLPFKEVVRTCVLSKDWLDICKSTPNIEFNELFFVKPDQSNETREAQRRAFLEFIKSWIENHKGATIDKFSLSLSMPANVGEIINESVAFATQRGVKELDLDFVDRSKNENGDCSYDSDEALFELPSRVYEHISLESLKLYSCSFIETKVLNFHALKEVSLGWMEVRLTAIKAFLFNCKKLECLSFTRCWNSDKFDLGEEEHMGLTKLFLDKCNFDFDYFRVKAPNLKIFKYCGWINFAVVEIDSLAMEEVDLDFSLESSFEEFGHPIYNLVKDVCTARVLTVCSFVLQVIPTGPEQLRMEVDMDARHLIMKTALDDDEFIGISFFLNSCPLLERLTIEIGPKSELSDYEPAFEFTSLLFWIEYLNVCECLISSLEVVEINGFRGTLNEYRFLEYLIFSGYVLKKIIINMLKDDSGTVMEKFSLRFSMPGNHDSDIIDQCVSFATEHGMKELELDFADPN